MSAIVKAIHAHPRKEADFYPTPFEVTAALDRRHLHSPQTIWEPAAGAGDMSGALDAFGHSTWESDVREEAVGITASFLSDYKPTQGFDWIITNPPFSLAEQFIRRSWRFDCSVAMLLKSTYFHAKSRLPLFQEYPPSHVHPLTWRPHFLPERGKSPLMEVAWFVWRREFAGRFETIYEPLQRPSVEGEAAA